MAVRLHHIGLVTPSISEFAEIFRSLGFSEMTQPEPESTQKVMGCFINVGDDVYIELLEPLADDSPITNFLEKRGGGLHHLCFEVDDISTMASKLVEEGFQMVSPPVESVGFDRSFKWECIQPSRIAFFLANKILIELFQKGR